MEVKIKPFEARAGRVAHSQMNSANTHKPLGHPGSRRVPGNQPSLVPPWAGGSRGGESGVGHGRCPGLPSREDRKGPCVCRSHESTSQELACGECYVNGVQKVLESRAPGLGCISNQHRDLGFNNTTHVL